MTLEDHTHKILETGIEPFDLMAPAKLVFRMDSTPRPCQVCGKEMPPYLPLRNLIARTGVGGKPVKPDPDPHAPCRAKIREWQDKVNETAQEDDMVAAYRVIQDASEAADRLWSAKLNALDVPDWLKESEKNRQHTVGCYCGEC